MSRFTRNRPHGGEVAGSEAGDVAQGQQCPVVGLDSPADSEVHPTWAEPATSTVFHDPNDAPTTDSSRRVWRSGCGALGMNSLGTTSSVGIWGAFDPTTDLAIDCTAPDAPSLTCLGGSHVYVLAPDAMEITICAIMYDAHGTDANTTTVTSGLAGGVPKKTSEITAGGPKHNGDNGAEKNRDTPLGNTCAPITVNLPSSVDQPTN